VIHIGGDCSAVRLSLAQQKQQVDRAAASVLAAVPERRLTTAPAILSITNTAIGRRLPAARRPK
jgi:hypothetical protein